MPKGKLLWRFRKGSEADPILEKPCGCRYYCYDDTVVRFCIEHAPKIQEEELFDKPERPAVAPAERREDPSTRQAVISIWRQSPRPSKDVPCTLTVQFIIRDGLINTFVNMRSSDAWLGVPYDFFNFSMLAGYVLLLLRETSGLSYGLGDLYLYAGSHHLYDKNLEEARSCIKDPVLLPFVYSYFDPLRQVDMPSTLVRHLWCLAKQEKTSGLFLTTDLKQHYEHLSRPIKK